MLNKVIMIGYVGALQHFCKEKDDFVVFVLATSKDNQHRVVCTDKKLAKEVNDHLKEGSLVFVEGSLHTFVIKEQVMTDVICHKLGILASLEDFNKAETNEEA